MRLRIWRSDPTTDEPGSFGEYEIDTFPDMVVLDAVLAIQRSLVPDLAVRWNCKAGRCGSCSAEVNGRPVLMCTTPLSLYENEEALTITPLRTFPLVKDIVTDPSRAYEAARRVPPFQPDPNGALGAAEVERQRELRKCIECFLCQDVCHVLRDQKLYRQFVGPRHLLHAASLELHPLDALDRRKPVQETLGLGYCNVTRCCTDVCPEGIRITDDAIIPLKERLADRSDPLRWVWDRLSPPRKRRALPVLPSDDPDE
ncbi:MAG: succinate dehydrogenase/fumarate reductase iron-sulfur subunit [Labilithrix sp.]|nr:succinate dehydrogenase/fumarate reductase iron-sulfur subunit [Labilithrix sp.]MCW5811727.1 succinate dehydrogenase/fumarate reductase iron-sulfur subunit [Labilithrix sp.]